MARPETNPRKPVVRVKISPLNYRKVLALALTIQAGFYGHAGFYPSPNPSLIDFGVAITAFKLALTKIGTKSNKGTAAALVDCKDKCKIVYDMLQQLAIYVGNIVNPLDPPSKQSMQISWTGFATKSPKSKIPPMQFPTFLKALNTPANPWYRHRVDFKKPRGNFKGVLPKGYNVYKVTGTPEVVTFDHSVTKSFTFMQSGKYEIRPITASGEGLGQRIVLG